MLCLAVSQLIVFGSSVCWLINFFIISIYLLVVIQHVLEDNKQEPPTIASIIQTIQTARRLIAHAHGKKPKGDEPLPTDDSGTPGSRQLMVELDARMKEINDAMANYNP